jgi:RNA polymerase sigma-70 factor (ECF subfamily)
VPEAELAALIVKAQAGDRAAFEKIVVATARLVYSQIAPMVRDRQKAEDLAQETFLRAWRGLGSLEVPGGFTAWLLTLARHVTLDALKAESRRKRRDPSRVGGSVGEGAADSLDVAGGEEGPDRAAARAESQAHALRLLAELPEEYRQVLALRYLGGADYQAIRERLGLTDGALRGLLTRGMALLRERMSRLEL